MLHGWLDDFHAEVFGDAPRGQAFALLWSIGTEPVSMALVSPPTAGVSRIGPVFTPVDRRGHGYGSAVTAAAAQWASGAGATDVVLFTDLANPVSNAIYRRIGFEPVAEFVRIDFMPRL